MQTNPLSAERVFTRISNLQHGSASRPQLVANGVGSDTIDRRLACGLWIPVAPAVFRSAARPSDWKMVTAAAALEGHADAVIAGWSSLALHGLQVDNELVALPQLLVPHTRTHESPVASVRQVCGWPDQDIVELPMGRAEDLADISPFSATSVARSMLDVACWARNRTELDQVRTFIDACIRTGGVSVDELIVATERAVQLRRRGARRFLIWLLTREVPVPEQSELERLARRKFTRWGVDHLVEYEVPHPGYPGTRKRADAVCRSTRKVFEFDSHKHHRSAHAFEEDRERDARTVEAGWSPIRLTWKDFTVDSAMTARRVRRLCGLDGGTDATQGFHGGRAAVDIAESLREPSEEEWYELVSRFEFNIPLSERRKALAVAAEVEAGVAKVVVRAGEVTTEQGCVNLAVQYRSGEGDRSTGPADDRMCVNPSGSDLAWSAVRMLGGKTVVVAIVRIKADGALLTQDLGASGTAIGSPAELGVSPIQPEGITFDTATLGSTGWLGVVVLPFDGESPGRIELFADTNFDRSAPSPEVSEDDPVPDVDPDPDTEYQPLLRSLGRFDIGN